MFRQWLEQNLAALTCLCFTDDHFRSQVVPLPRILLVLPLFDDKHNLAESCFLVGGIFYLCSSLPPRSNLCWEDASIGTWQTGGKTEDKSKGGQRGRRAKYERQTRCRRLECHCLGRPSSKCSHILLPQVVVNPQELAVHAPIQFFQRYSYLFLVCRFGHVLVCLSRGTHRGIAKERNVHGEASCKEMAHVNPINVYSSLGSSAADAAAAAAATARTKVRRII